MLPNPPHPGAGPELRWGSAQDTVPGRDCAPSGCSPVLQLGRAGAARPVPCHDTAAPPSRGVRSCTTTLGQLRSGVGLVSPPSPPGDAGKGVGAQPRSLAGAGGARICAASCSPQDLLSAEADGWRGAAYCGADTGVSTISPARASPSGSHHAEASADHPLQKQQSSRASGQLQIAMPLQQGQRWGFGGGCATHLVLCPVAPMAR